MLLLLLLLFTAKYVLFWNEPRYPKDTGYLVTLSCALLAWTFIPVWRIPKVTIFDLCFWVTGTQNADKTSIKVEIDSFLVLYLKIVQACWPNNNKNNNQKSLDYFKIKDPCLITCLEVQRKNESISKPKKA